MNIINLPRSPPSAFLHIMKCSIYNLEFNEKHFEELLSWRARVSWAEVIQVWMLMSGGAQDFKVGCIKNSKELLSRDQTWVVEYNYFIPVSNKKQIALWNRIRKFSSCLLCKVSSSFPSLYFGFAGLSSFCSGSK